MIVASIWPRGQERISHVIVVASLVLCAIFTALWLVPGDQFFGGAIHITIIGKALAYAGIGLALIAVILAEDYLAKVRIHGTDFRMLILAMAMGLFHLPLAGDLATLFIAFELVSIPSYVLAGFNHGDPRANEAGMKYLVLGAFASSLFLLGLAFLYGATGEIHLASIQHKVALLVVQGSTADLIMVKAALVFLMGSLLFKTGVAPLHFWLADVYEGANMASLAFLSVPVKVASFGLLGLMLWGPESHVETGSACSGGVLRGLWKFSGHCANTTQTLARLFGCGQCGVYSAGSFAQLGMGLSVLSGGLRTHVAGFAGGVHGAGNRRCGCGQAGRLAWSGKETSVAGVGFDLDAVQSCRHSTYGGFRCQVCRDL